MTMGVSAENGANHRARLAIRRLSASLWETLSSSMSSMASVSSILRPPPARIQAQTRKPPHIASRVSFAEEPWADEESPLLGHDGELKRDPRPVRKSKGKDRLSFLSGKKPLDGLPQYMNEDDPEALAKGCMWIAIFIVFVICIIALTIVVGPEFPTSPSPSDSVPLSPFPTQRPQNPAYLVQAKHGAVASDNRECSNVGVAVLQDGGSAVDAAVASVLCTGVVTMFRYVLQFSCTGLPFLLLHKFWDRRRRIHDCSDPSHDG